MNGNTNDTANPTNYILVDIEEVHEPMYQEDDDEIPDDMLPVGYSVVCSNSH